VPRKCTSSEIQRRTAQADTVKRNFRPATATLSKPTDIIQQQGAGPPPRSAPSSQSSARLSHLHHARIGQGIASHCARCRCYAYGMERVVGTDCRASYATARTVATIRGHPAAADLTTGTYSFSTADVRAHYASAAPEHQIRLNTLVRLRPKQEQQQRG
jgi:hypothetical protein